MLFIKNLIYNTPILDRLFVHIRTPLYRNGYALTLNTVLTSGLGIFYWFLASHAYSTQQVGLNSAAIAAMTFLAGISGLNLDSALMRFIPRAGKATTSFIIGCYLTSAVTAALVGSIFLLGIQIWLPGLAFLVTNRWLAVGYVFSIVTISLFSEQDAVLTGLRQATWVPLENSIYAIAKIALLWPLSQFIPQYGIFVSFTLPAVALVPLVSILIFRYLSPNHSRIAENISQPLDLPLIVRYTAGNFFGLLFFLAYVMLPPVMVLQLAGSKASAYFYLPWMMANSLRLFATNMSSSLIVEGSRNQNQTMVYFRRSLRSTFRILLPVVIFLILAAPFILHIFGESYAYQGSPLLRLLLLATLPGAVVSLYIGLMKVYNHVGRIILIQAATAILVLSLSYTLLPDYGISSVGWALLIGHSLMALLIMVIQVGAFVSRARVTSSHTAQIEPSERKHEIN
jgi:O-antigen/teichoic acid export membrane protein